MSQRAYSLSAALILATSPAFAADEPPPSSGKTVVPSSTSETKVATSGSAKLGVNLFDSTRVDTPDVDAIEANLGVDASKGIGSLKMRIQFTPTEPVTTAVNELNVNLALPLGLGLGVGRYDFGIKNETDTKPRGLIDAARASYNFQAQGYKELSLNVYYGNAFKEAANFASQAIKTQWHAYGASLIMKWDGSFFEGKYATEPHRLTAYGDGTPPSGTLQEWSIISWAAGFEPARLGGKAYGEFETLGEGRTLEPTDEVNKYKSGSRVATAKRSTTMLLGGEIWADSSLFDVTGIFAPEDRLTAGLSAEYRSNTWDSDDAGNDTKLLGKVGYNTGTMKTWFEYEHRISDKETYRDSKAQTTKQAEFARWVSEYLF